MTALQVRTRTSTFEIVSTNLSDLIDLPDPEAAEALNTRMGAFEQIERIYERTYAERTIIVRQFESRRLWQHLIDPDTGERFPNLTAWLSCSRFLGCRRVNFEAMRDGKMLADVPSSKLIDVPKGNLKVLTQLSTAVRNDPGILEAARTMPQDEFLEKVEKEQPLQHIERRSPMHLTPGRSERRVIDKWVKHALENDIAGSLTEAIVRACEIAMYQEELAEELKTMPVEGVPV